MQDTFSEIADVMTGDDVEIVAFTGSAFVRASLADELRPSDMGIRFTTSRAVAESNFGSMTYSCRLSLRNVRLLGYDDGLAHDEAMELGIDGQIQDLRRHGFDEAYIYVSDPDSIEILEIVNGYTGAIVDVPDATTARNWLAA